MVVPLQDHLPAQLTEVAVVEEVVSVHLVRAVGRAHGDGAVAGARRRVPDGHDVVPQRVEHGEEEEGRVEGGGGPERGARHREDGRDEEAEVEHEGDRRGREEVDGGHHVEQPQLQHPGEHVCVGGGVRRLLHEVRGEKNCQIIIFYPERTKMNSDTMAPGL